MRRFDENDGRADARASEPATASYCRFPLVHKPEWSLNEGGRNAADWLEKLGMSEYAQRFAENKIDVSVLRHLTDQDLKDIGVPLGHRPKILAAVSDLGGTTPVTTEPAGGSEPKAQDTAERRQVTVMFVALLLLPAAHRQRVLSSAKWIRRRMRSQNVVWTQELLVGGKRRRSEPFAAQASTNAMDKAGAARIPAQLSVMARISEFLAIPTAPRLRRASPPKS